MLTGAAPGRRRQVQAETEAAGEALPAGSTQGGAAVRSCQLQPDITPSIHLCMRASCEQVTVELF